MRELAMTDDEDDALSSAETDIQSCAAELQSGGVTYGSLRVSEVQHVVYVLRGVADRLEDMLQRVARRRATRAGT